MIIKKRKVIILMVKKKVHGFLGLIQELKVAKELLQKMRLSARKKVVLVEPINNNANSNLPLWGAFARWVSRVDGREVPFHFDRESLERLCDELSGPQRRELVCGDRDMRVVLEAGDACLSAAMQKDGICAKTS